MKHINLVPTSAHFSFRNLPVIQTLTLFQCKWLAGDAAAAKRLILAVWKSQSLYF